MMKSIALLSRRADFSRERFREYYETRHARLAIGYFPFAKYVRNHLREEEAIGFDTISEFWSEHNVRLAGLMEGEIGELMRADERRFMDRAQISSGASTETLVTGTPRGVEPRVCRKHAWLLARGTPGGAAPAGQAAGAAGPGEALTAAASDWGRAVAQAAGGSCERVSLDVISPWPGAPFPFEAILWFWMRGEALPPRLATPAALTLWRSVAVDSHETAPADMEAALRAGRG